MNTKHVSLVTAVPVALMMAGLAFGQTMPPSSSMSQSRQQMQSQRMRTSHNMVSFDSLAGSKGYISKTDAGSVPWLSKHFRQCDTSQNNKLSRSEFNSCKRRFQPASGRS